MVDFKSGYKKLDGNARARCAFFGGRCRENFYPQEFDPTIVAEINSTNNLVGWMLDDAAFVKLREIAASYQLPDKWIGRSGINRASITIAGRNLHTWTDYGKRGGLDPEAFFLSGTRGSGGQGASGSVPLYPWTSASALFPANKKVPAGARAKDLPVSFTGVARTETNYEYQTVKWDDVAKLAQG
jgi:hypothetical protein